MRAVVDPAALAAEIKRRGLVWRNNSITVGTRVWYSWDAWDTMKSLDTFEATTRGEVDTTLASDVVARAVGRPQKANFDALESAGLLDERVAGAAAAAHAPGAARDAAAEEVDASQTEAAMAKAAKAEAAKTATAAAAPVEAAATAEPEAVEATAPPAAAEAAEGDPAVQTADAEEGAAAAAEEEEPAEEVAAIREFLRILETSNSTGAI